MRTHLYRGVLALLVALVFSAPAFAQGIVKGIQAAREGVAQSVAALDLSWAAVAADVHRLLTV